jgi:agmatinase
VNPTGFLDLPDAGPQAARVTLLPLPFEGTVSFGGGTAAAPVAILAASAQVELWDDEQEVDLATLAYHWATPVHPGADEATDAYLARVEAAARPLHHHGGLVIGIGGEHSLTPPLVAAAAAAHDGADLTVVQLDAHADLRDEYAGTPHSHACAMRRLVERGVRLIAIGIRSVAADEAACRRHCPRIETFTAAGLARDARTETRLLDTLAALTGRVYLTIDIDAFETHLCPGTGTPQPGGLAWWQALQYLACLLRPQPGRVLIGADLVEVVPQPTTQVNQFVAARLLAKMIAYAAAGA